METNGTSVFKKWIFFLTLLVCQSLISQNEGKVWYFGANAGLDFNQNPPVVLNDGQLNTLEGSASISDAEGNLLFYTDGVSVYTSNHQLMPNGQDGIGGHFDSSQSALIVPFPDNSNLYYLFAITPYPQSNLVYSIIDMELNNGLGDVVENFKAIPLLNATGEYIQAIGAPDRSFWWIMTHKAGTTDYYAYHLTSEGLDTTNPVISSLGWPSQPGGEIGFLKFNSEGNRLVRSAYISGYVEISDFDTTLGVVSNAITFNLPSAYGVEFSPNNHFLYVSSFTNQGINQFSIDSATTAAEILATQYVYSSLYTGSLQVAPNGKIYASRYGATSLDVIHSPNNAGTDANFQLNYQSLGDAWAQLGFPNIISTFVSTAKPTLANLDVQEIEHDSAIISATLLFDGGNEITQSGFYFGTHPDNLDQTFHVEPNQGVLFFTLLELEPETTYHFSAFATNTNGTTILEGGYFTTNAFLDTIPPVAICIDTLVLYLDDYGIAFLSLEMIDNGSFDNDAIAEMFLDKTHFTCEDLGENLVTLTVVDVSGNSSSCTTSVFIADITAPEIFVEVDSGVQQITSNQPYELPDFFDIGIAWSIDNCSSDNLVYSQTPPPGTLLEAGTHLIELTSTDESGNSSSVSFEILIEAVLSSTDFLNTVDLTLFPNPTTEYFKISAPNHWNIQTIEILDLNGRLIGSITYQEYLQNQSVQVGHLSASVYLIALKSDSGTVVKKLIKR